MPTLDHRFWPWADLVGDLVRQPLTVFPHVLLEHQFAQDFDAEPSWNWVDADGSFGFEILRPPPDWPPTADMEYWRAGGMQRHPLIKWLALTDVADVQTIGRVPLCVAGESDRAIVREQLRPVGLDQQLTIPYRYHRGRQRTFVLARTGEDFPDEDVALARRLLPLFTLLDRQVAVLAAHPGPGDDAQADCLTGRELAVLQLLADGHTAAAIARRLTSSPRTVHKHLEHIYRKLEVRDRLTAVRVAQLRGLLGC